MLQVFNIKNSFKLFKYFNSVQQLGCNFINKNKEYNTVSKYFLFNRNMFAHTLLVPTVHTKFPVSEIVS